jgi:hypothetical protein
LRQRSQELLRLLFTAHLWPHPLRHFRRRLRQITGQLFKRIPYQTHTTLTGIIVIIIIEAGTVIIGTTINSGGVLCWECFQV